MVSSVILFFFFKDTATTEIYTLHIVGSVRCVQETGQRLTKATICSGSERNKKAQKTERKSKKYGFNYAFCCRTRNILYNLSLIHISEPTRLGMISYAVFCLKKKKIFIQTNKAETQK
eukprot:TRINITY_DN4635_c0_g1_i1.p2 TRINITY_DN4635_c0_g1~~TRINITY_DN4635_c0_g1_i1.p2  ORF type:complete len:118 (-),score=19.02 TRINITY_DN4635_c0_g1_i1:1-354(-)